MLLSLRLFKHCHFTKMLSPVNCALKYHSDPFDRIWESDLATRGFSDVAAGPKKCQLLSLFLLLPRKNHMKR
jgi:hypothetical protein